MKSGIMVLLGTAVGEGLLCGSLIVVHAVARGRRRRGRAARARRRIGGEPAGGRAKLGWWLWQRAQLPCVRSSPAAQGALH